MRQRYDAGTLLVTAGATVLLISLFLDWFSPGLSAWGAFEAVDVVLAGLAAGAIAVALTDPSSDAEDRRSRLLPLLCAAALALVASQVIDAPPAAGAEREVGLWLALGATIVMTSAALLSAARISVVVDVQGRDRRHRVAAVDRRDAPPEAATPSETATAPLPAVVAGGATQDFEAVAAGEDPPQGS